MLLFLVRHGKAETGSGDDAARRLTGSGKKAVRKVARRLAKADVRVDVIEHSGLVRAEETARVLAEALDARMRTVRWLTPEYDAASAVQKVQDLEGSVVMLVGHMPFMGRMASYLLTGDADACSLHFSTAAVACLEGQGESWSLEWLLPPDLA